ncbi:MAG: hypothetical protein KC416_16600 [Myxococcales bacterium]|nr:hypothetical protein [Myxococcales bacterium]
MISFRTALLAAPIAVTAALLCAPAATVHAQPLMEPINGAVSFDGGPMGAVPIATEPVDTLPTFWERIGPEVLGGMAGLGITTGALAILGIGVAVDGFSSSFAPADSPPPDYTGVVVAGGVIAAAGSLFVVPLGVAMGGERAGARGNYWHAVLGATIGGLGVAGGAALGAIDSDAQGNPGALGIAGIVLAFASPVIGAVVGYELGQDDEGDAEGDTNPSDSPNELTLRPTFTASPDLTNVSLGLAGTW